MANRLFYFFSVIAICTAVSPLFMECNKYVLAVCAISDVFAVICGVLSNTADDDGVHLR